MGKKIVILATFFTFYLNIILKVNGQITSCYLGQTTLNDTGRTLTVNCRGGGGSLPQTGCQVTSFFFRVLFIVQSIRVAILNLAV